VKNLWKRTRFLWFSAIAFGLLISNGNAFASIVISNNAETGLQSNFQNSAGDPETLLVQSTEITINLEKRMPSQSEASKKIASREVEKAKDNGSSIIENSQFAEENNEVSAENKIVPGTIELSEAEESFDDMEDPFAEEEENIPVQKDPFESYNRWMYSVNEGIYDYFFEPVARGYRAVVHENVRLAIRNVFDNALSPVKLVSSAAQGDVDKSARVLSRLVLNTTVGLGGLFDVAGNEYGIENVNEDMDQALAFHGVPTGPYIVLPFFGPSSARDATGKVMDSLLSPTTLFSPSFLVGAGITIGDRTNSVSFIIDDKKSIDDSALDEYESVRDFYHQFREGLIAE